MKHLKEELVMFYQYSLMKNHQPWNLILKPKIIYKIHYYFKKKKIIIIINTKKFKKINMYYKI